jgi:hypothetical protein
MRVRTDEAADALYIRLDESAIAQASFSILTRVAVSSASRF